MWCYVAACGLRLGRRASLLGLGRHAVPPLGAVARIAMHMLCQSVLQLTMAGLSAFHLLHGS